MNFKQKYLKYKKKYIEKKNQLGGFFPFYFFIEKEKDSDGDTIEDRFVITKIPKNDPSINQIGNYQQYKQHKVYDTTANAYYIQITNLFDTTKLNYEIIISNNLTNITLNLDRVDKQIRTNMITIVFSDIISLDQNFKGRYKIENINLSDTIKNMIRSELNLDPATPIPMINLNFLNINIDFNTFNEFVMKTHELFIKYIYKFPKSTKSKEPTMFDELRIRMATILNYSNCQNDKRFIEFITTHYLHQLYSEIDVAHPNNTVILQYLMTKPGNQILLRILRDKIQNNRASTTHLCDNKILYSKNEIKYVPTKINVNEILIKDKSNNFINLPPTTIINSRRKDISILLDSGNSNFTIIGRSILTNHLGFIISDFQACSVTGCGIGGAVTYTAKIDLTIKFSYYNKEFTFPCIVDDDLTSVNSSTILFGWNNFLEQITEQGYALFEKN